MSLQAHQSGIWNLRNHFVNTVTAESCTIALTLSLYPISNSSEIISAEQVVDLTRGQGLT
jgi:hypothetical protein